MKKRFLKILLGVLAFIIGGLITVEFIRPFLISFIPNEKVLDIIHIVFNIVISVGLYKLVAARLIK